MLLGYVYKLKTTQVQELELDRWLSMLFFQYNWNLKDRRYHYEASQQDWASHQNFPVVSCPLTCSISRFPASGEVYKDKPNKKGYREVRNAGQIQDAELKNLKKARPWYKECNSTALQQNIKRLDKAYQSFWKEGKGFPKPKCRSKFRSFTITNISNKDITENGIYISKLGWVSYFNSRPIPEGFIVKSATLRRKANGWYISIKIEDKSVPQKVEVNPEEVKTVIGLDMGLTKIILCSDGSQTENPRFATNKKSKQRLRILSRRASRKKNKSNKKGNAKKGKNKNKAYKILGNFHLKIKNKREAFEWKTANNYVKKADAIIDEKLNIKGMKSRCKPKKDDNGQFVKNGQSRKTGLNRSISDASWLGMHTKIRVMAEKSSKLIYQTNPKYTSQKCRNCGHIDKDNRDGEKFICVNCGHIEHADIGAAKTIRDKGITELGLAVRCKYPAKYKKKLVLGDSQEPLQLNLGLVMHETPTPELTGANSIVSTVGKRRRPPRPSKRGRRGSGNQLGKQLSLFNLDEMVNT